ncbi:MAG TPA: hypothetical protein VLM40_18640, partial [Gemmata sp.]|nr:hypothetical protein [Gemmata sp.]
MGNSAAAVSAPLTATPPPAGGIALQPESLADRFFIERRTLALFLISVLGLFLELLLIRWISTEIRIFAYLQNCVLVVCFLGLGMGCWDTKKSFALRDILLPLCVLVALLAIPPSRFALSQISAMLGGFADLVIWSGPEQSGWGPLLATIFGSMLTFGLMILLWQIFVPVGRLLGRLMSEHPNTIAAYSVNVAGSLVGIWLFVLASAFYLPPFAWFAIFFLCAIPFLGAGGRAKWGDLAFLTGIVCLGV